MFLGKNGKPSQAHRRTFVASNRNAPPESAGQIKFLHHREMPTTRKVDSNTGCPVLPITYRLLPNQRVRLYFPKGILPPAVMQQQFGHGQFVMHAPIELPIGVLKRLGIGAYTIRAGTYSVQESEDYVMVDV